MNPHALNRLDPARDLGGVSPKIGLGNPGFFPGGYRPRVAIVSGDRTLYHVPGEAARAMVTAGAASPKFSGGRVREIEISYPATAYATRLGEPSPPAYGVRFHRWRRLDGSATRIVEHHPRALYVL